MPAYSSAIGICSTIFHCPLLSTSVRLPPRVRENEITCSTTFDGAPERGV
jgi:hypothetical protein